MRLVTAVDWERTVCPDSVPRTMQFVGLDEIIHCYPTLRHALDA
ncbi:hypothetical protein ACWCPI_37550 [Streptomyces sp. NPDC001920]